MYNDYKKKNDRLSNLKADITAANIVIAVFALTGFFVWIGAVSCAVIDYLRI